MATENFDRFQLQLDNYRKALANLEDMLSRDEDDAVRDSILLRFVFTFEMAWKAIYYFLLQRGEERLEKNAWAVFQLAFTAGVIGDAGRWDDLRKYRNVIGHEYDEGHASEIVAYIRQHGLAAFVTLLSELEHRS